METTEQELQQAEMRRVVELRAEVVQCLLEGDDVEGLRALVARRGYAAGRLQVGASEYAMYASRKITSKKSCQPNRCQ